MAGISFSLQQPYIKSSNPEPVEAKNENLEIQKAIAERKKEIRDGRKQEKDIIPFLNKSETRIYMFLVIDRKHIIKLKTDFAICPIYWDFKKQVVKKSLTGHLDINERLKKLQDITIQNYSKLLNEQPGISFAELSEQLKKSIGKELPGSDKKEISLFSVFQEFIDDKKTTQTYRTVQKYQTVKLSLEKFSEKHYKNRLNFADIDLKFFDKYLLQLRTQKPRGRQKRRPDGQQNGLMNETIEKYISTVKNFMEWSRKRGIHAVVLPSEFRIGRNKDNEIIALTPDELKALYTFDFSEDKKFDQVRDIFCFAAFTGQRWSDVEAFKAEDILGDCWTFRSFKTKTEIQVFFIGYAAPALNILKKYNFILPKISQQKFNDCIKLAAEKAGINSPVKSTRRVGSREIIKQAPKHDFISSHTARRTAVSILLNYELLPVQLVQQITGHTKLEVLQKYIMKDRVALKQALLKTTNYNQHDSTSKNNRNEA